ncbi:hypothetical protein LSH36_74g07065 [Paralvinella palmiformis]|uniref:Uncharacterized protein n=1 Tax=Paralvinella palmiformis TaxID=53620 RepID=A0AAD9K2K8_9ANNE|nr:hypothetical protein LSH36_74g07065 [Paralvinella palmiformis]
MWTIFRIKEVVCFGEGAGANILARFAISHQERVLGVCLIHCTGTTAGFIESVKDKLINWRLDHIGMNPSAEAYLVIHRFGLANKNTDQDMLKSAIENYQEVLRQRTNPKNLKKFVDAFLKRTSLADPIKKLKCPVLMVTGSKSMFNMTTRNLHQILVKSSKDKDKVEFIEVAGVANVLEEKPQKLAECFQYFLQGLGLGMCSYLYGDVTYIKDVIIIIIIIIQYAHIHQQKDALKLSINNVSSVPMHHVTRLPRMRSLSMEEYDKPLRQRSISGGGQESPLSGSPSNSDPPIPQSVTN